MGGLYSKTRRSGTPSTLLQANTSSQLTAHLSSYEEACKRDPELQSFDATLHGRTNHVIKILADGVEIQSLGPLEVNTNSQLTADLSSSEDASKRDPELQSFDATLHERTNYVINNLSAGVEIRSLGSFKEVTNCLLEMNQDVVKVILESKEDIWNNPESFGLVEEYFKNSVKTLEFCTALESSLERAKNSQLIIQLAIQQFEEEVVDKKFEKTLEGLQKFKAAGDPFTPQFFALFESVYEQQLSMLKKLLSRKEKLDEKMKSVETWRRVSNVLFVSAFVSVLIFSVLAAAVAAPPVVIALAAAMTVPIGSECNWCNTLWNRYEKALEEEKGIVTSLEVGTLVTIKDMVTIRVLVNKFQFEITVTLLLDNADFEEDAVKLVIDEIKRKMAAFMESIEDLAAHAGKCHADIIAARRVILHRLNS
ncbi:TRANSMEMBRANE PROTEIN [Salix viminalis]|uniref:TRANSMEMBRANE PROTEIN n=1 Tax=Salix viminalis TaxID=40686 RepID=A0A9Q0NYW8_SALVM|nr:TRANSMEMBRANE PROTEIN [Salix viminalis]